MMRLAIFIAILFTAGISHGQDGFKPLNDIADLKEGIQLMAQKTNSITTSFKQEKHISILTKALKSEGKMFFKKPDLLKWAYTSPYEYAIIFKAESIIINDEGKVSNFDLSSSKSFMEINQIIMNSVSGNILQEEQFDISYFASSDQYLAKMRPKSEQMKSYIASIEVYMDKKDFMVAKIKLIEKGGDYTLIDFFNKQLNTKIADEVFQAK